jgi:peroxiredoxin Q/BCP
MLEPGEAGPAVSAPNQHGETVRPSFDAPTVVYFYPEDGTPGCTTEAEQFGMEREAYEDASVPVYGVSVDDVDSHRAFAEETGVAFDLLADPDGTVADAFGVPRDGPGGTTPRTTFVLADGEVHRVYTDVSPAGHPRDVLADLLEDGLVTLD